MPEHLLLLLKNLASMSTFMGWEKRQLAWTRGGAHSSIGTLTRPAMLKAEIQSIKPFPFMLAYNQEVHTESSSITATKVISILAVHLRNVRGLGQKVES